MAGGTDYECPQALPPGMEDAYAAFGASVCPWDMGGGGLELIGVLPSSLQ